MTGDFSRQTFDPGKHYLRVLMQQGRVLLDADWNEQAAILLHYLQALAADVIGPHGGPGFKILEAQRGFMIQQGNYYVHGRLCENENDTAYTAQPEYPLAENEQLHAGNYLVYLDVWERHINWIEESRLREPALGGANTATRSRLVWQVKTWETSDITKCENLKDENKNGNWLKLVATWQPKNRGMLMAQTENPSSQAARDVRKTFDSCVITPEARYRGPENQLYRVEIHTGGADGAAKFKWSRDNGAVIFSIQTLAGNTAVVEDLGRDQQFTLQKDDWVEIMDTHLAKRGEAGPLVQIENVDLVDKTVTLSEPGTDEYEKNDPRRPYLRRWESGPRTINESIWLSLEAGIQIQFQGTHTYRVGDFWLIPARTSDHDIDWPKNQDGTPRGMRPHGVAHFYAPLAIISVAANGAVTVIATDGDCRCSSFKSLCAGVVGELPPDEKELALGAALAPAVVVKPKAKPRAGKKAGG